jgi:hypothetical protein
MDTKQIVFRLPAELYDEAVALADAHDLTLSQVARAALRAWVEEKREAA